MAYWLFHILNINQSEEGEFYTAGAIGLMMLADLRFAVYGVVIWIFLNIIPGNL